MFVQTYPSRAFFINEVHAHPRVMIVERFIRGRIRDAGANAQKTRDKK